MILIMKLQNYGGLFDSESKEKRIIELETEMKDANFWNDKKNSEKVITELNGLKNLVDGLKNLRENIKNNNDLIELLEAEEDKEIKDLLISDIDN